MKGTTIYNKIPYKKKIIVEKIEGDDNYKNKHFILVPFERDGHHAFDVCKVDEGYEIEGELYFVSNDDVNKFRRKHIKEINEVKYILNEEPLFDFLDHTMYDYEILFRVGPNTALRRRHNLLYNPNYLSVKIDSEGNPLGLELYADKGKIQKKEDFIFTDEIKAFISEYVITNKLKLLLR